MDTNINKNIIDLAIKVLGAESETIDSLKNAINENFVSAISLILSSSGKVVLTGIGKSALIAQKIAATFNSTGQTAVYMHAGDALHGDIGILHKNDIVICLSKSGDTPEIKTILPYLKRVGNKLIALTGNRKSALASVSDCTLDVFVKNESCIHNLTPTSSTTAALVMGDTLAICLMYARGFTKEDFAFNHPAGSLGKKMFLKVSDIYPNNAIPSVRENASIDDVILEISSKRLGATAVKNKDGKLTGIITDGDLRRMLKNNSDYRSLMASDIMSASPKTINPDFLATEALTFMRSNSITQLIVAENEKPIGFIHLHDLLKEGIS